MICFSHLEEYLRYVVIFFTSSSYVILIFVLFRVTWASELGETLPFCSLNFFISYVAINLIKYLGSLLLMCPFIFRLKFIYNCETINSFNIQISQQKGNQSFVVRYDSLHVISRTGSRRKGSIPYFNVWQSLYFYFCNLRWKYFEVVT